MGELMFRKKLWDESENYVGKIGKYRLPFWKSQTTNVRLTKIWLHIATITRR